MIFPIFITHVPYWPPPRGPRYSPEVAKILEDAYQKARKDLEQRLDQEMQALQEDDACRQQK